MDKQNVVYPYNGILFGHKKEWGIDTCYNTDEWTLKTCGSVREAGRKRPHIIWFSLHEMSRIGKYIDIESSLVIAQDRVGGGGWR